VLPEEASAASLLDGSHIVGMHAVGRLFALRAAGLIAAVSEVPAHLFQEDALNALLQDMTRVGAYALRHDEAIRALMASAPALVPLAFGTVYVSPTGIVDLLNRNADQFHRLLAELDGKQEWTLKVRVDTGRVTATAENMSSEAQRLAEKLQTSTTGRAYLLEKQRLQAIAKEAARLQADALEDLLQGLGNTAAAVTVDDLPQQDPSPLVLALKAALLVDAQRLEELRAGIDALQEQHAAAGLSLEVTGPWPPYSFVGAREWTRG
ncbi:MAG: GvpL/GvpF family gas vesicle protein, partial [Dehalococcoidia bacterium]